MFVASIPSRINYRNMPKLLKSDSKQMRRFSNAFWFGIMLNLDYDLDFGFFFDFLKPVL